MNTIITPTDFSPVSLNAVQYAADMAMATKTNLLILHATEMNFGIHDSPIPDETDNEEKLAALKKDLMKRTAKKIKINTKQVSGIIENELMKICDKKNPFAVVMATHGASLRKLFFIGSITVYLSRNLNYPVIVVPENVQFKPIQKIALATDLKNVDDLPQEKISSVVQAFNAGLHVIHIHNNNEFNSHSTEVKKIKTHLQSLNPEYHFINNKNVQQGIFSFVEKEKIDMILTFPKKHAFFHNSESKLLIFNSPITVMTIH